MGKKDLFCAAFVMILLSGCSEFEWNPDSSSCGNRLIEIHEQCDDGNQVDEDGCSVQCQIEEGYECLLVGQQCTELCGNGRRDPKEQCDDGNKGDGDGCSKTCDIEEGWYSYNDELCQIICGNGVMDPDEQCDDGNTNDNDGCSNECKLEEGWYLKDNTLYHMECGNGVLDPGEQCDDENKVDGDGCSKTCEIEWGYECLGTGQSCKKLCGNGKRDTGEQCDFAREQDKDGCTDACQVKNGWYFNQAQALVEIECGNGTLDPGEQCDDGDTDDDNGCSRTCRVEEGWICSADGVCINLPRCGNGQIDYGEECDDGNDILNDGCSPLCTLMPIYYQKNTICGDGYVGENEECDDGNEINNDGCDNSCKKDSNYECISNQTDTTYLPVVIRDFRGIDDGNKGEDGFVTDEVLQSFKNKNITCNLNPKTPLIEFGGYNCNNIQTNELKLTETDEKPYFTSYAENENCYSCPESIELWYTDNNLNINIKYLHTIHATSNSHNQFIYHSRDDVKETKMIYKESDIDWNSIDISIKSKLENLFNATGDDNQFLPLGALKYKNNFSNSGSKLKTNDFLEKKPFEEYKLNNHFTLEAKGYFQFKPDEKGKVIMKFNADDSIWVFINYKLALDFGGAHSAASSDVELVIDSVDRPINPTDNSPTMKYNEEFNLVDGGFYPIHIFFAERGGGSVLNIDTPLIYSPSICKPK